MFKNIKTNEIWNNRKEAVKAMGQGAYKRALKKGEFKF